MKCRRFVIDIEALQATNQDTSSILFSAMKMQLSNSVFVNSDSEILAQTKLETFVCAVRACGCEDVSSEQVECMLANLIHQGLVKGYIAHKQQVRTRNQGRHHEFLCN